MNFDCFIPTKLLFGAGRLEDLGSAELPGTKALIVISAGTSMKKMGYLDRVIALLQKNGVESVVFDKILPNPVLEHVIEGAETAKANNCDMVIGLGGGSSIDSAKSIAVMASNEGDYWDYVAGGSGKGLPVKNNPLPIIAITTTAGTGTEMDPWTVITKTDTNEKIGFGYEKTFPVLSIVDPELMVSVPPKLTAYQGFDALFHAVEGYIATIASPLSDLYALESIRLIAKSLPAAVKDGSDIDARSDVALANTLSGMVESTSCCVSQHSMEHALSAFYPELPHGAGLIMLSESYFTFFADKIPERMAKMAEVMGEDLTGLSTKDQALAFVIALSKLKKSCNVDALKMSDFGIEESKISEMAANARVTMGNLFALDRYELSPCETEEIMEKAFS